MPFKKPALNATHTATLLGSVTVLLSGCSSNFLSGFTNATPTYAPQDSTPVVAEAVDTRTPVLQDGAPKANNNVARIRNAIPKNEANSRYGNHSPYEVKGKTYEVLSSRNGYVEEGQASWYGEKFAGKFTSTMETYDPYEMTAAHKSLPLPTYARVTNLENNRTVIVRINDRGPFHDDRLIDLSYAAAVKLGFHQLGSAKVRVTAIDPATYVMTDEDKIIDEIPTIGQAQPKALGNITKRPLVGAALQPNATSKQQPLPAPADIPVVTLVNNKAAGGAVLAASAATAQAVNPTTASATVAATGAATTMQPTATAAPQTYSTTTGIGEPDTLETWSSADTQNTPAAIATTSAATATETVETVKSAETIQSVETAAVETAAVAQMPNAVRTETHYETNSMPKVMSSYEPAKPAPAAPKASLAGDLYLQAGAFKQLKSASKMKALLNDVTQKAVEIRDEAENGERYYRVLIGPFINRDQALATKNEISDSKVAKPMIVRR